MPYFSTQPVITYEAASLVLGAASAHARSLGVPVCIAVADRAGHLMAFGRQDGAPLLSAQIAQDKAYSVAAFGGVPTHEWWNMLRDEPPLLHGIVKTDRLIVFGGGVPVLADGTLIGAVGVSGGSAQQDQAVAEAGAQALSPGPLHDRGCYGPIRAVAVIPYAVSGAVPGPRGWWCPRGPDPAPATGTAERMAVTACTLYCARCYSHAFRPGASGTGGDGDPCGAPPGGAALPDWVSYVRPRAS